MIIGGGTAGSVVASRLSADPDVRVCLLKTEFDYDDPIMSQMRGNSYVRHSRASFRDCGFLPPPDDFAAWVAAGATGWSYDEMLPYWDRLSPVAVRDRSPLAEDFVAACRTALGVPIRDDFNDGPFTDGAGFLPGLVVPPSPDRDRPNLTILDETRAEHLDPGRGVTVRGDQLIRARHEYVLCAGAISTPILLLRSGIGPAAHLENDLGFEVRADLPGVGEHLLDHPASVIVWEAARPIPEADAAAGLFVRRDPALTGHDLAFQLRQTPEEIALTAAVPRPRAAGRLRLSGADPWGKPVLEQHPDSYDERTLVDGMRLAREVAVTEPFASWITREIAPGPDLRGDEELTAYGRAALGRTAGTCRIGAVVDPELRLHGFDNVRIADASVFPEMPSVNPAATVLMVAERAADLISESFAGEKGRKKEGEQR
ncbi:choline dehydrogenase-like flavoprotein [Actinoplanes lutulentus]|uniref:Choline dehydrogenase-like flavoprotein n=1 Tax=Actinoplanes lutulentus TaxID=1287878 RepID=A0A327ZDC3_9ACTN|nr:choline dehydrogenase-like flavoprotein [Actinoplanes lutulentus]